MSSKVVTETGLGEVSQAGEVEAAKGKVEKKSGKRINYHYIVVKSYKKSQKNDVVKCLYIKGLTNFGFCVIKEGSKGDTKDKEGRDVIDRLKWQRQLHEELAAKIRMPKLLDTFEENGNYYLVIEHIKGRALAKEWSKNRKGLRESIMTGGKLGRRFLGYLIQITDILIALHACGVVHRDATPNNYMITPGGKVALIDMEMCYSLQTTFPTPAFRLGTHGYMSPQQEKTVVPTAAEDIFALGSIILQVWSGISPGKVVRDPITSLKSSIPFLIDDKIVAETVLATLNPDDSVRPSANQVKQVLVDYVQGLGKEARTLTAVTAYSQEEIAATLQEVLDTLSTPLMADAEKGWFADNMEPPAEEDKHKLRKVYYASYDRGAAGILMVLAQAKMAGFVVNASKPHIASSLELIRTKYISRMDKKRGGLHFGSHGIAAALADCWDQQLIERSPENQEWIRLLLDKEVNGWSVKNGVAGLGLAMLACEGLVEESWCQEQLRLYAERLITDQSQEGCWISGYRKRKMWRPKRKVVDPTLGDGMAGVIQYLLLYGEKYRHMGTMEAAHKGLEWLVRQLKLTGDTVISRYSKLKRLPVGLMDGVAGISQVFLKAYEITRREQYAVFARKLLRTIPERYVDGSLGLQSGVSGLGEVYLEAYRILGDREWWDRAGWLVELIMRLRKRHLKYGIYWLVEHERVPVANIMVGNAGVIRFLLAYASGESMMWAARSVEKQQVLQTIESV